MPEFLDIFNLIAGLITIVATSISIILWFKYRERDRWVYSSFLSVLEGLNRIVIFTRLTKDANVLPRVGDISAALRDNVVSSMKAINSKRGERLKSWEFGYKDAEDKLRDVSMVSGEMNPAFYVDSIRGVKESDKEKIEIVFGPSSEVQKRKR